MKHSRYDVGELKNVERVFLKEKIDLTGSEISINTLPKGSGFPFIHSHRENEEVYIILKGSGLVYLDGVETEVAEGTTIRISPEVKRGFMANDTDPMQFICIQSKVNSIDRVTREDGIRNKVKASWLK